MPPPIFDNKAIHSKTWTNMCENNQHDNLKIGHLNLY